MSISATKRKDRDLPLTGFIGQGFIGKNYADDFERRGYPVVRYAREEPYAQNRNKIAECDIVFIAVPTPTTTEGFDDSIVRDVLALVGERKIAVIKSTLKPGTTEALQEAYAHAIVLHSPEFLRETTAAEDAVHPERNIVGIPLDTSEHHQAAKQVLAILPRASHEKIMKSREAELVKYAGNCFLYTKVVFMNLLYDLAQQHGIDFETIADSFAADSRIGPSHTRPVHASGHEQGKSGRGAGGHCFIKDFAAFMELYEQCVGDERGVEFLRALQNKNNTLLKESGKDLDLLRDVHGGA